LSRFKPDPRRLAWEILERVEQGGFSDLLLDAELQRYPQIDSRDRGLLTELVYGVLRRQRRLDHALSGCCSQPLAKVEMRVRLLLRLGAYQILELDRIPDSAAVNTTVELAKTGGLQRATGFVNGVLRGLLRSRRQLVWPDAAVDPRAHLQTGCSLPDWLAERWLHQFGADQACRLGEALLGPAPLTLRVNSLQGGRDEFIANLRAAGGEGEPCRYAPLGVKLASRAGLESIPAATFQVQDEASMLIADLLQPLPGDRLLDACAAPGGKTTQLAALTGNRADILALDLHPPRVNMIRQGAERLGCRGVTARPWDLTSQPDFLAPESFDRVLLDAPCSGLGVVRRNPELRWRRQEEDLIGLADLQCAILENVAPLLKPGGLLVYWVCTQTVEETEQVIDPFLDHYSEFTREDLRPLFPDWEGLFDDRGALITWPGSVELDGFFAVRMRKCN